MIKTFDIKQLIHEHFKPIFYAYDKDKNSTLQKEQIRVLLADNLGATKQSITNEQLDWHFSRIDEDGDGKITFQEYFAHFFGSRAVSAKNEQSQIDIVEFRRLMENTFRPLNITITEQMVRWNFDKIDTDHSGFISFDQYLKFVKKYNP